VSARAARAARIVANAEVTAALDTIADLLEIADANPFRVRAYRNAARVIADLPRDVAALCAAGEDLAVLPGIGRDLATKIAEIATTGESATLRELVGQTPPALTALLRLPGLGPKRIRALHEALGVATIEDLAAAAKSGFIHDLPGFGAKIEQRILATIEAGRDERHRFMRAVAAVQAEALILFLQAIPGVVRAAIAGSYRRGKETVGDLDVVVTADDANEVMDRFVAYDAVERVDSRGPTRASVILRGGLQVDLRLVDDASYGAALYYFTGSKAHVIAVRRMGQERGLRINEYGVFRGEVCVAGATEESVFQSVGLPFIPPELREARGEIEAALTGKLPVLIEPGDLRGDLHAHTDATDGRATLRAMAEAARALGHAYLAITDHSRRLTVAHGLDPDRLLAQIEAIDRLNGELHGIVVLKGIEVDILEDGRLDLPDEVLARLDLVVGAVHSAFTLGRAAQTKRLLRAMDHPYFSILAHPSARLLQGRAPLDVDLERVLRHARARGCFVELDAQPARLDVDDVHAKMARDAGVLVAISSDAHSVTELRNQRFGVTQARRGWLEKTDVLNTRPLRSLRALLRRTMGQAPTG
jgi:DNA polymerase (family 10)